MSKVKGSKSLNKRNEKPVENVGSEEEEIFTVETILDSKVQNSKTEYLVKWKNYSIDKATWEPEEHLLPKSKRLIKDYQKKIYSSSRKEKANTPNRIG